MLAIPWRDAYVAIATISYRLRDAPAVGDCGDGGAVLTVGIRPVELQRTWKRRGEGRRSGRQGGIWWGSGLTCALLSIFPGTRLILPSLVNSS